MHFPLQPNSEDSDTNIKERVEEHDCTDIDPKSQPDIDGAKADLLELVELSKLNPRKGKKKIAKDSAKDSVRQVFTLYYELRQMECEHSEIQEILKARNFKLLNDNGRHYFNQLERELQSIVTGHVEYLQTLKDEEAIDFVTSETRIPINEAILHDLLEEALRIQSKQSKKEQAEENSPTGELQSSSNSSHTRRDPLKSKTEAAQKSEFNT